MGSLSRYSRNERFIKEFGDDILDSDRVDTQKTWKVVSQALKVREYDECVVMYFLLNCVETGEELELSNDCIYFDPETTTAEDMVDSLAQCLGLNEKQTMRRIKKADLS